MSLVRAMDVSSPMVVFADAQWPLVVSGAHAPSGKLAVRVTAAIDRATFFSEVHHVVVDDTGAWQLSVPVTLPPLADDARRPFSLVVHPDGALAQHWQGLLVARAQPGGLAAIVAEKKVGLFDPTGEHRELWKRCMGEHASILRTLEDAVATTGPLVIPEGTPWSARRRTTELIQRTLANGRDVILLRVSPEIQWKEEGLEHHRLRQVTLAGWDALPLSGVLLKPEMRAFQTVSVMPRIAPEGRLTLDWGSGWPLATFQFDEGARLIYCGAPLVSELENHPIASLVMEAFLQPQQEK